jgi:DEAD/DEAH box helicase domain-containing protein
MYTNETLGWGEIDLPEQTMETTAYWLVVPDAVVDRLRASGAWDVEPIADYGPNWEAQRNLARQRDGCKCRTCGAPEKPGRQHDVHHITPFREFGYARGENDRYLRANELGNLLTLCHNCHVRAETSKAAEGALHGLAHVLVHLAPLFLMASPQDLGSSASVRAPGTRKPTIYLYDGFPGGIGFAERLYGLHRELLRAAEDLIRACPCSEGCPSCVGPVEDPEAKTKAHTLALIQEMLRLRFGS